MSKMLRAQLWEFSRTNWWEFLGRFALSLVYVIFGYWLIFYMGLDIVETCGFMFVLLLWNTIPTAAWSNESGGETGSRVCLGFARPISTRQLVIAPMLFIVVAVLISFLTSASLFFWLVGKSLPMAGPSALAACVVCWCIAIPWSTSAGAGRLVAVFLIHGILFSLCLFPMFGIAKLVSWEFSWFAYCGLALLSAVAVGFAVLGVQRRRFGESLWTWSIQTPHRREGKKGVVNVRRDQRLLAKPFRNPWTAQCWFELRQVGKWLLFAVLLVPILIVAFIGVANHYDPGPAETFYTLASSLLIWPMVVQLLVPVSQQLAGTAAQTLSNPAGPSPLSVFEATRPMRSDHLMAIKLLLVVAWSWVSWLIMAVAAYLYLRFLGDWDAVTKVGESFLAPVGEFSAYWWMVELVGVLLLFASTATLTLFVFWINALFQRISLLIACGLMSVGLALVVFDIKSEWSLRPVWITYGYLFAVGTIVLCIMGLKMSLKSGVVGKPFFVVSLSVWTVFVCATVALSIKLSPAFPASTPVIAYVVGAAMLLVPMATTTAAPMGHAIYRHG